MNFELVNATNGYWSTFPAPILEPPLNMHRASYMLVITYIHFYTELPKTHMYVITWKYLILGAIPAIHEISRNCPTFTDTDKYLRLVIFFKYESVNKRTNGRTDKRTLPSALSPCFAKATRSIINALREVL